MKAYCEVCGRDCSRHYFMSGWSEVCPECNAKGIVEGMDGAESCVVESVRPLL